jgi:SAM-dependent methyltransferase
MLAGLPAQPDVVDVGAGTGQLALALLEAGAQVTAVEPGAEQRRMLESRVGGRARVLDARGEDLPLEDDSADVVICADSFHWLDAGRATAEFRRVLRREGRLCLSSLMPAWKPEESAGWADETGKIIGPLWERAGHPLRESGFVVQEPPPGSGFERTAAHDIPFTLRTDRDGLLALFGSWSAVAALPDDERAEVRTRLAGALDRHGVGELELTYVAQLRLHQVT